MSTSTAERILEAALESFGTRGYDATSLDALAAQLELSKQTILYWYPSKDALMEAVIARAASVLITTMNEALDAAGQGWSRVEAVVRAAFRLAARQPAVLGMLREVSRLGPPAATQMAAELAPLVDRAETLEGSRELLRMLLPRGIELTYRLQDPGGRILIEASVFEQILVNLVGNAKDAMPGGGRIDLWLHGGALPDGTPAAVLEIQDSGSGIPLELQETIFEAFFTTKPLGAGTGLGLASVRTQMEALGGTVTVASSAGQGTCFRLGFPLG